MDYISKEFYRQQGFVAKQAVSWKNEALTQTRIANQAIRSAQSGLQLSGRSSGFRRFRRAKLWRLEAFSVFAMIGINRILNDSAVMGLITESRTWSYASRSG